MEIALYIHVVFLLNNFEIEQRNGRKTQHNRDTILVKIEKNSTVSIATFKINFLT